jgi:hypothetical protein
MNTVFRNRFSFWSAIAMGFGVSTGYPLGIIAAAGTPLVCLTPGTRKAAFRSTLGYYVAATWPMVPGLDRYSGQSATSLIPIAMWVLAAILLSVPWTIAWTSDRPFDCLWRVPLALLATIVPPLGVIGLASPLTAAGYLFPERLGSAWRRSRSSQGLFSPRTPWLGADVALFHVSLVPLPWRSPSAVISSRGAMLCLLLNGLR